MKVIVGWRMRKVLLSVSASLPVLSAQAADAAPARLLPGKRVRVATFNASLNRNAAGQLVTDLSSPDNAQARAVAEIIQRVNPDILLINEFDYVPDGRAADLFRQNYLSVPQNGGRPVNYPHAFVAPSNTGVASGFDLNNNGEAVTTPGAPGYGDDALGFGFFPGQFGMAVFSKHKIRNDQARTFQKFLWKDMPGARLPDNPATPAAGDFYSAEELEAVRLSSKSHWDVPVEIDGQVIHVLASHPTPPVFDGPEDRNGLRNADEIRLLADYLTPGQADYLYDDAGGAGGLAADASFVVVGDMNSDPLDGDSLPGAIQQLLDASRVNDAFVPASAGAVEQALAQGGANVDHEGDPKFDTADFLDNPAPGNLRVDYVLPSDDLEVAGGGVFWPESDDPLFGPVGTFPFPGSDHRLVFVDLVLDPGGATPIPLPAALPWLAGAIIAGIAAHGGWRARKGAAPVR